VTELVVVVAPLVLLLIILGFRSPTTVLLPAYAATVPFGSLLSTGLSGPYGSLSSVLGFLLLISLASRLLLGRLESESLPSTVPIWLIFLALTGASGIWSISPRLTQAGFINLASLVALYVLLAVAPAERQALRRTEMALVLGGVVATCYGLAQLLFLGGLPTSEDAGPRFGRDLLGANNTAAALLLPLAIAVVRSALTRRAHVRLGYVVAAGLLLTGIILTGSRGGLVAVGATFLVALMLTPGRRHVIGVYILVALLGLAAVLVFKPAGLGERQERTSSSGRTEIWAVGLYACKTYCIGGAGWGTFGRVYELEQPKVPEARVLVRGTTYEAHNIWILIGVEVGVLGLVLAAIGLSVTARDLNALPHRLRAPPLVALAGTVAAGFFLSNFEYKFFWMTLMYGLLCRNVSMARRRAEEPAPERPAIVLGRT
jgi:O-antigen ligase